MSCLPPRARTGTRAALHAQTLAPLGSGLFSPSSAREPRRAPSIEPSGEQKSSGNSESASSFALAPMKYGVLGSVADQGFPRFLNGSRPPPGSLPATSKRAVGGMLLKPPAPLTFPRPGPPGSPGLWKSLEVSGSLCSAAARALRSQAAAQRAGELGYTDWRPLVCAA
jgi:hypothetical protein